MTMPGVGWRAHAPNPVLVNYPLGGQLDVALNNLLEQAHADGVGTVALPPSSVWSISEPINIKAGAILDLQGSVIRTTVDGAHAVNMTQPGGATPTHLSPMILNGRIVGTPGALGGVLADTATGAHIYDVRFEDFPGTGGDVAETIRGAAIHLRNGQLWNENVWIIGCTFKNCRHWLVTTPADVLAAPGGDVDPAGGTDSFARLRFQRAWGGGGAAAVGWPVIYLRGSVYAATISDIGGNINGDTTVIGFGDGWMPGTVIEHIGVEAHQSTPGPSAMFEAIGGAWPAPPPIVGDGIDPRNHGMTMWKGEPRAFAPREAPGGITLTNRTSWPQPPVGATAIFADAKGRPTYRPGGSPHVWPLAATKAGPTSQRPTAPPYIGFEYYDTALGRPVYAHQLTPAVVWHDATGATV